MLILRKGKTKIGEYETAYALAEDTETLSKIFPSGQIESVRSFLNRNAFQFALCGAKARLGNGIIFETKV